MIKTNLNKDYLLKLYGDNVIASMTDKKGIITFVTKAYETISGYSAEELIGKPHNIVRHPDMPSSIFKEIWETISSGQTWIGEVLNLKKDGGFYWVSSTITPYKDENNNIVGYSSVREDISANKELQKLNTQVYNMLDNLDEGFLIFDENFNIQKNYTKKCLEILNQDSLYNKDISEVLFENNIEKKEIFDYAYSEILKTDDELSKDLLLSLLPSEHYNEENIFTIKYKLLPNKTSLLLLFDVTRERELENSIKYEQQLQKMIIAIAKHKKETVELVKSFLSFIKDMEKDSDLSEIKRNLHTFKGLFAQLEMLYITDTIHNIESEIKKNNFDRDFLTIFMKSNLEISLKEDLTIISDILGKDFLSFSDTVTIERKVIESIRTKVKSILDLEINNKIIFNDLLNEIDSFDDEYLIDMLKIYKTTVQSISISIKKDIYPLEIIGDNKLLISKRFKYFIDTLVHIFRNAIVHGIEYPDIRESLDKNRKGKIICKYEVIDRNIIISITDDGKGINENDIILKAIDLGITNNIDIEKLSSADILQFIFLPEFTTAKDLNKIAGRGIGLSCVKDELLKLNGSVEMLNKKDKGLSFIFTIPYMKIRKEILNQSTVSCFSTIFTKVIKLFLENDILVNVNKIKDKSISNFNRFYSSITFENGDVEILLAVSIDESLINKVLDIFIPELNDISQREEMLESLPNEIVNIIGGLSIRDFPSEYEDLNMSEPIIIDQDILKSFQLSNVSLVKELETNSGSLECTIIIIKKD
ncbi:MAG: PAS domain S-box protein [Campylobacterota bacterium]|nr:PAS domain S-box protein [Campylobacterota bacterium]